MLETMAIDSYLYGFVKNSLPIQRCLRFLKLNRPGLGNPV